MEPIFMNVVLDSPEEHYLNGRHIIEVPITLTTMLRLETPEYMALQRKRQLRVTALKRIKLFLDTKLTSIDLLGSDEKEAK